MAISAALFGCASVPRERDIGRSAVPGIYHETKKGETVWSIARLYDVGLENIIRSNRLPDAGKIEVGQLIFIPDVTDAPKKAAYARVTKLESFIWPVRGAVSSYFGSTKNMAKNKGIDIRAKEGQAVLASASGKVSFASEGLKGYGKTVIIEHAGGFETVYAHNSKNLVNPGSFVKQGAVIAKAGKTGRVKKPTLHFEIRKKHKPQNPFYYLP